MPARAPQSGDVYVYDGQELTLVRPHGADTDVWICRLPNGSNTYVGAQFLTDNQPIRLSDGTAVVEAAPAAEPAAGATTTPATSATTAAPRRRSRTAERHEDPEESEEPQGEIRCPSCGTTFVGQLGREHACDGIVQVRCARCGAVDLALLGRGVPQPHLCESCRQQGIVVCKMCGRINSHGRASTEVCQQCSKVTPEQVWFTMVSDRSAVGDSIVEVIRTHRPYAVEVESFLDPTKTVRGADPRRGPDGWHRAADGSIQPDPGCNAAVEFRSLPLRGDQGLIILVDGMKKIRNMGYRSNRSCGFHVHIDALDLVEEDKKAIHKFGKWIEEDLFKLVTNSRRENNFCRKLGTYAEDAQERYKWLNIAAWDKHRTIENRLHHGITLPDRAQEWVKVCVLIIERGLKLGRMSSKPSGSLFDLLSFTPYQRTYWTTVARKLNGQAVTFE